MMFAIRPKAALAMIVAFLILIFTHDLAGSLLAVGWLLIAFLLALAPSPGERALMARMQAERAASHAAYARALEADIARKAKILSAPMGHPRLDLADVLVLALGLGLIWFAGRRASGKETT